MHTCMCLLDVIVSKYISTQSATDCHQFYNKWINALLYYSLNVALSWFTPTQLLNLTWQASTPDSCITVDQPLSCSLWRVGSGYVRLLVQVMCDFDFQSPVHEQFACSCTQLEEQLLGLQV